MSVDQKVDGSRRQLLLVTSAAGAWPQRLRLFRLSRA
jgi:hypothetical protein